MVRIIPAQFLMIFVLIALNGCSHAFNEVGLRVQEPLYNAKLQCSNGQTKGYEWVSFDLNNVHFRINFETIEQNRFFGPLLLPFIPLPDHDAITLTIRADVTHPVEFDFTKWLLKDEKGNFAKPTVRALESGSAKQGDLLQNDKEKLSTAISNPSQFYLRYDIERLDIQRPVTLEIDMWNQNVKIGYLGEFEHHYHGLSMADLTMTMRWGLPCKSKLE